MNTPGKVEHEKSKAEKGFRRVRVAMAKMAHLVDEEHSSRVRAEQVLSDIDKILGKGNSKDTLTDRVRAIALLARTRQMVDRVRAEAKPFTPEIVDELREAHEELDKAGAAQSGNASHSKAVNLTRLTAAIRIEGLGERIRRLETQNDQLQAVIGRAREETHEQWRQALRDSEIAITRKGPDEIMQLLKNREMTVRCISKEGCAKTAEEAACSECRTNVGKAVRGRNPRVPELEDPAVVPMSHRAVQPDNTCIDCGAPLQRYDDLCAECTRNKSGLRGGRHE